MKFIPIAIVGALGTLRVAAATFTVTSSVATGPGSLAQAILDANANPGPDIIAFDIADPFGRTISTVGIPDITEAVTIDGTTQSGYAGTPLIQLGGDAGSSVVFNLTVGQCVLRGLAFRQSTFNHVALAAVQISGPGGNTIAGCTVGLDPRTQQLVQNSGHGILIADSPNNVIGGTNVTDGNLITRLSGVGILISGPAASNNVVQGNQIGLDLTGTNQYGNFRGGVIVSNAPNNTIGGVTPGARNVISGNSPELQIAGPDAANNSVLGNFIGVSPLGTALPALLSPGHGIRVDDAPDNVIGGTSAGARNIVAGNNYGVILSGTNATGNSVQGNFIGTDITGAKAVPNVAGIYLSSGASGNLIGGTAPGARNLISANHQFGISVSDGNNNTIQGNFIGTDLTGTLALGNGATNNQVGALVVAALFSTATNNLIGGGAPGAGNLISGNNYAGLVVISAPTSGTRIQGNFIGVDRTGQAPLGNLRFPPMQDSSAIFCTMAFQGRRCRQRGGYADRFRRDLRRDADQERQRHARPHRREQPRRDHHPGWCRQHFRCRRTRDWRAHLQRQQHAPGGRGGARSGE